MDISESIKQTEYAIQLSKNLIHILEECGNIDLAKEEREKIKDLETSLEHERQIQLAEAQTSGRKEWYHYSWKYFLFYVGGIATIKLLEFMFEKLN